ncbi:FAD-dependent oxidoreductase [Devosia honganensis]|uniref:FAD-dependent oxidoreductase n=1 Tax=Devosia honganensis TaxID=1610527 RepID=A0ABV7X1J7_9HYPH
MRPQLHRLPADAARGFAGRAIDRARPVHFRLDGRLVSGFAGDTVLSAALASGIDTLGLHRGMPVGLTPRSSPVIALAGLARDPLGALPMARTPAVDGAEFVTLGAKRAGALARLFQPGRTLGLPLDEPHVLDRPWRAVPGLPEGSADLMVVGAGVAGLSAALAGARAGLAVMLVEATALPGGHSGLFGTQEGEDAPEESMARLAAEAAASDAITLIASARVFSIRPGLVRLHRVDMVEGRPRGRVVDIEAPRIVIATGALERLPLFPGNRLPGVALTLDAHELAARYGVWPGASALFATGSNPAYRLAMLASDVGIAIGRILDSRPGPASRFIEFSRAYGMVQSPGTGPAFAETARAGNAVRLHADQAGSEPLEADRLLVCGGWQPDLTLWHVAGGHSRWHDARHRLEPSGALDGVALAGSAAGWFTRRGCIQSGADAVDLLLGRPRKPVDDPRIDPLYETPDAPVHIAPPRPQSPAAYLDAGAQLLPRPEPPQGRWRALFRKRPTGLASLSEAPQPLAICEVAAGVGLGLIPPEAAGVVAQERVALVPLARPAPGYDAIDETRPAPEAVPPFLAGRFGPGARVVRLVPAEERLFEPGSLIYRSSDVDQPLLAIGVVLRPAGAAATALVAGAALAAGLPVTVRDQGRAIPATLEAFETEPA